MRWRGSARDHVGIVFQSFHLIPTMTALENVAVPLEFAGRPTPSSAPARTAPASASATGSTTIPASSPAASSSGWRWPARSWRTRRSCWRTSRPATSTKRPAAPSSTCCSTQRERGTTLLLVTHDLALARRCGRTVRIAPAASRARRVPGRRRWRGSADDRIRSLGRWPASAGGSPGGSRAARRA